MQRSFSEKLRKSLKTTGPVEMRQSWDNNRNSIKFKLANIFFLYYTWATLSKSYMGANIFVTVQRSDTWKSYPIVVKLL